MEPNRWCDHLLLMVFTWILHASEVTAIVGSCPDRCYCFDVSHDTPPPNALLLDYIQTNGWTNGSKAVACWGRPNVPDDISSDTNYLLLIGSEKPKRRHRQVPYHVSTTRGRRRTSMFRHFQLYAFPSVVDIRRNIRFLPEAAFRHLQNIIHIDLHGNKIKDLPPNTFSGLSDLEILDLTENRLKFLHPRLFQDAFKLRKLRFSGNFLRSLPEALLQSNQMIEHLDASDNLLSSIDEDAFQTLRNVKFLNLSHNRINENSPMIFTGLLQMSELYLQMNKLTSIDAPLFLSNTHIKILDLSHNRIKVISRNAFQNQRHMQVLDLSGNHLQVLDTDAFRGAHALRTLDLSGNRLKQFSGNSLSGLHNLSRLDMNENRLNNITQATFGNIPGLTHLTLAGNNISTIAAGSFVGLDNVDFLDLSRNAIQHLSVRTFQGMNSLMELHLANNRLRAVEPEAFKTTTFSFLSRLLLLDLQNNDLMELQRHLFRGTPSLRVLIVSKNKIDRIVPEAFSSSTRLHFLRLNDNRLETLQDGIFRHLKSLDTLDISNNSLREISDDAFRGLGELNNLFLAHNKLTNSNMDWLHSLSAIKTLNLDNNQFTALESENFETASTLRYLHLSNNNITNISIEEDSRLYLYNLTLANNRLTSAGGFQAHILPGRALDLSRNPWHCGCTSVSDVSNLIRNQGVRLSSEDQMRCNTPSVLLNRKVVELARSDYACAGDDVLDAPSLPHTTPTPMTPPLPVIARPKIFHRTMRWSWVAVLWDSTTNSPICNGALVSSSFVLAPYKCLRRVANLGTYLRLLSRCRDPLDDSCGDAGWTAPRNLEVKMGYQQRNLKDFQLEAETYRVRRILKVSHGEAAAAGGDAAVILLQLMPHVDLAGPASVIPILGGEFPSDYPEGKRVLASGWWTIKRSTTEVEGRQKRRHYRISTVECGSQNDIYRPFLCGDLEQDLGDFASWDPTGAPVAIRVHDEWKLIGLLLDHEGNVGRIKDVRSDREDIYRILEEETVPEPITHPY
ncbi:uncharacterized protein [Diadema antillarum]|uniref:uncharacterized protein n=1 Tax=Diadema antillarum TaxID=105358 RepID=UPI003A84BA88